MKLYKLKKIIPFTNKLKITKYCTILMILLSTLLPGFSEARWSDCVATLFSVKAFDPTYEYGIKLCRTLETVVVVA